MAAIEVRELCRTYRVFRKREGLWASVRGLFHREYDVVSAVRNVSFTIEEGEMVAFLGPNGAGKTTTLKLLSGLVVPTSGTATVLGHVPWKREDAYRRRFRSSPDKRNNFGGTFRLRNPSDCTKRFTVFLPPTISEGWMS
jgi:ABC-2 type transport system ATP-binding protein